LSISIGDLAAVRSQRRSLLHPAYGSVADAVDAAVGLL
jgi:hypothetical protein